MSNFHRDNGKWRRTGGKVRRPCCCDAAPCACCVWYYNITGADYANDAYYMEWDGTKWTGTTPYGNTGTIEWDAVNSRWKMTLTNGVCSIIFINTETVDNCPDGTYWTLDSNGCGGDPYIYEQGCYTGCDSDKRQCVSCEETYVASIPSGAMDCSCVPIDESTSEHVEYTWDAQDVTMTRWSGCIYNGSVTVTKRRRVYATTDCTGGPTSDETTSSTISAVLLCNSTEWVFQVYTLDLACTGQYSSLAIDGCCPVGTFVGYMTVVVS